MIRNSIANCQSVRTGRDGFLMAYGCSVMVGDVAGWVGPKRLGDTMGMLKRE